MKDEQGNFWTLPELLADLDRGEHLYLTPKMCADLAAILRAGPYVPREPTHGMLKALAGDPVILAASDEAELRARWTEMLSRISGQSK